jgi:hypothetical protein
MLTFFMFLGAILIVSGIVLLVWIIANPKNKYKAKHAAYDVQPRVSKYWHPTSTKYPYLWMKSIDMLTEGRRVDTETTIKMLNLKARLKEKWDNYNEMSNWKWLELYRLEQYQW